MKRIPVCLFTAFGAATAFAQLWLPPNPSRVDEIAAMLSERAELPCPPISDRAAWGELAGLPTAKDVIRRAEKLIDKPVPELPDYFEFSRNGNRSHYQEPYYARLDAMQYLLMAECLENRGRFVAPLERFLRAIADEHSWVLPAHDRLLDNWYGRKRIICLFSAERAWAVALAVRLLDKKLNSALAADLRRIVFRQVTEQYLAMAGSSKGIREMPCGWAFNAFNWNRVCHAGCCSTVLLLCDDRRARAAAIEFAERALPVYLAGFGDDGYCEEGMGYWNYGFGNHLLLAINIRHATCGKVDLLANAANRRAAAYPLRYRLNENGLCPSFADGDGKPSPRLLAMCATVWPEDFPKGSRDVDLFNTGGGSAWPAMAVLVARAFEMPRGVDGLWEERLPLRDVYERVGYYALRGDGCAVALKAHNPGKPHSHNDAGSYFVSVGGVAIAGDPGAECYTGRTFSSRRFESKVLNSYGHPVPMVDGCLQEIGGKIRTKVVSTSFSDACDEVSVDLTGAYPAASNLVSLVRTFTFDRGARRFTVRDAVRFSKPSAFESATVTRTPDKLKGRLKTSATGGEWEESTEVIEDPGRASPHRTAVRFRKPVTDGSVEFVFSLN